MISSVKPMRAATAKAGTNFQKLAWVVLGAGLAFTVSGAGFSASSAASEWSCMTAKRTGKADLIETYCNRQEPPPSKFRRPARMDTASNTAQRASVKGCPDDKLGNIDGNSICGP